MVSIPKDIRVLDAEFHPNAMKLIYRMVRWLKLNYGVGKTMCTNGAEVLSCPHCDHETPVYRSDYDSTGAPLSFSVCLWCDGLIEYGGATMDPHEPYASAKDLQTDHRRSKP